MAELGVPPNELFMYASWDACEKILGGLSLKATPPNALNDPFECLPGGYEDVTDDKLVAAVTDPGALGRVRCQMIAMGAPADQVDACIRQNTTPAGIPRAVAAIRPGVEAYDFTELLRRLSERYGIICFAEKPDCLLMWSHYADRHRGVVIGFRPSELAPCGGPLWLKVGYSPHRPRVIFQAETEDQMRECVTRVTSTKAPCWAYESEWRLVVRLGACDLRSGVRLWQFPAAAITRVILGCKAAQHEGVLAARLREAVPVARMERAQICPGAFRLELVGVAPAGGSMAIPPQSLPAGPPDPQASVGTHALPVQSPTLTTPSPRATDPSGS